LEKLGIPTITITTTEFVGLAKDTALSLGAADSCLVVVPHPMGMISLPEITKKAEKVFPEILRVATGWAPKATDRVLAKPAYPAEILRFNGTEKDVNDLFFKNGWSLGVPIISPTPERVKEMLKGTSHRPDEVVALVPPRNGVLTVELIAVHAVMAGAKPQYMPVILAAVEAMLNPQHDWRGMTTTTNPNAPLVVVNGPIRDEIGIAYGAGALGGEQHANISIGLTLNSIEDTVGGSKPPNPDKTTLGWQGNIIATVLGENEEINPWGPFHARRGFKKEESVVSVTFAFMPANMGDHDSVKGEDLLLNMAWGMLSPSLNSRCMVDTDVLVVLSPEHLATIYNDGWKKEEEIQKFLWDHARFPLKTAPARGNELMCKPAELSKLLGQPVTPDTLIPIVRAPSNIKIIIAGGPGKHSQYFSSAGPRAPRMISVPVDKWR
jgi:hypothetical protein